MVGGGGRGTPCFCCPMLEGGCHGPATCIMYRGWAENRRLEKQEEKNKDPEKEALDKENKKLKAKINMLSNRLNEVSDKADRAYKIARRNNY